MELRLAQSSDRKRRQFPNRGICIWPQVWPVCVKTLCVCLALYANAFPLLFHSEKKEKKMTMAIPKDLHSQTGRATDRPKAARRFGPARTENRRFCYEWAESFEANSLGSVGGAQPRTTRRPKHEEGSVARRLGRCRTLDVDKFKHGGRGNAPSGTPHAHAARRR